MLALEDSVLNVHTEVPVLMSSAYMVLTLEKYTRAVSVAGEPTMAAPVLNVNAVMPLPALIAVNVLLGDATNRSPLVPSAREPTVPDAMDASQSSEPVACVTAETMPLVVA